MRWNSAGFRLAGGCVAPEASGSGGGVFLLLRPGGAVGPVDARFAADDGSLRRGDEGAMVGVGERGERREMETGMACAAREI